MIISTIGRLFLTGFREIGGGRFDPFFRQKYFENIFSAINNSKYKTQSLSKIILNYKKGIEVGSNEYLSQGIPFVRVADINDFSIDTENANKKISEQRFEELKNDYQPKIGEILYSKDGTIGFSVVVEQKSDYIISGGIMRITCSANIDNYFLKYLLSTKLYKQLADRVSIGTVIKHLTIDEWLKILVPLPPSEKQRAIAFHISTIKQKAQLLQKEAIQTLQQAKEKIEQMILE